MKRARQPCASSQKISTERAQGTPRKTPIKFPAATPPASGRPHALLRQGGHEGSLHGSPIIAPCGPHRKKARSAELPDFLALSSGRNRYCALRGYRVGAHRHSALPGSLQTNAAPKKSTLSMTRRRWGVDITFARSDQQEHPAVSYTNHAYFHKYDTV